MADLDEQEIISNTTDEKQKFIYQRSKLLNAYYDKVGKAFAGTGHCAKAVEFRAGYGLVDNSDSENPVLLDIPADMTEVPNEFYRASLEGKIAYSNGTAICSCEIPVGAVSEPARYNLVGIFDQDGDLIAVCTTLSDWVTPTEADRSYPTLTFPLETVDLTAEG